MDLLVIGSLYIHSDTFFRERGCVYRGAELRRRRDRWEDTRARRERRDDVFLRVRALAAAAESLRCCFRASLSDASIATFEMVRAPSSIKA